MLLHFAILIFMCFLLIALCGDQGLMKNPVQEPGKDSPWMRQPRKDKSFDYRIERHSLHESIVGTEIDCWIITRKHIP